MLISTPSFGARARRVLAEQRPVISNTTPLISLDSVGLVDLLPRLYGAVVIAEAVLLEFEVKAHQADPNLRAAAWLRVVPIAVPSELAALLDIGEAATIALAEQMHASLVLLDQRRGRRIANTRGLPVIGTGAVLIEAKQLGLISAVAPVLDAIIR